MLDTSPSLVFQSQPRSRSISDPESSAYSLAVKRFNLNREAAPLAPLTKHCCLSLQHRFNLNREAAPLATCGQRALTVQLYRSFNLNREAAPLATAFRTGGHSLTTTFQSQPRSRSISDEDSMAIAFSSSVFQSQPRSRSISDGAGVLRAF